MIKSLRAPVQVAGSRHARFLSGRSGLPLVARANQRAIASGRPRRERQRTALRGFTSLLMLFFAGCDKKPPAPATPETAPAASPPAASAVTRSPVVPSPVLLPKMAAAVASNIATPSGSPPSRVGVAAKVSAVTTAEFMYRFDGYHFDSGGFTDSDRAFWRYSNFGDQVEIIRLADERKLVELPIGDAFFVTLSPDGRRAAALYRHDSRSLPEGVRGKAAVKIWDMPLKQVQRSWFLETPRCERAAFSPDGATLAVGSGHESGLDPGELSVWDVATGRLERRHVEEKGRVERVRFSPDGALLAWCAYQERLTIWDRQGQAMRFQHKLLERAHDLKFSADGATLAVGGGDGDMGSLELFRTADGRKLPGFENWNEMTYAVAFAPAGDLFATASMNVRSELSYSFWSLPEGKIVRRLRYEPQHRHDGLLDFSSDGRWLVAACFGGTQVAQVSYLFDDEMQRTLQALKQRNIHTRFEAGALQVVFADDQATDDVLKNLPVIGCPCAIDLYFNEKLTDAGLAELARQKNLVGLKLSHCQKITAAGFAKLAGLPLRRLEVANGELMTPAAVTTLGEFGMLEALSVTIHGSYGRPGTDLTPLAKLTELRELDLRFYGHDVESIRPVASLPKLEKLQAHLPDAKDDHLRPFERMKTLRSLELHTNEKFTGAGLTHFGNCVNLEQLELYDREGDTDADLAVLRNFSHLRDLHLSNTHLTDRIMPAMAGLKELEYLEVPAGVTDAGIVHLAELTRLRRLFCYGETLTDRSLLQLTKLTALEQVGFGYSPFITGVGYVAFQDAKNLKSLDLERHKGLTDDGLRGIGRLTQLEYLVLPSQITDAGLPHLARLTNLTVLRFREAKLTDAALPHIVKLSNLKSVGLAGSAVTDEGIQTLARLKELDDVDLEKTHVTKAGIERLRKTIGPDNYVNIREP